MNRDDRTYNMRSRTALTPLPHAEEAHMYLFTVARNELNRKYEESGRDSTDLAEVARKHVYFHAVLVQFSHPGAIPSSLSAHLHVHTEINYGGMTHGVRQDL